MTAADGRMEDRWALDDIAELAGFHRDAHPAEVVNAVRAALAACTPPENWPPSSWMPYVALRLFARSLVALDKPTMVEARRITSLDDIIRRARNALAVGDGDPLRSHCSCGRALPCRHCPDDAGVSA